MAELDYIDHSGKSEITKLSDQLNIIASRMAGFLPILRSVADSGEVGSDASNTMELIGGMAEYINDEIMRIAAQLEQMDKKAA
jgi:hypothetical protein